MWVTWVAGAMLVCVDDAAVTRRRLLPMSSRRARPGAMCRPAEVSVSVRRLLVRSVPLVAAVAVGTASCVAPPTASPVVPPRAGVGPLFSGSASTHYCTASVVDSPHGNLLVTAAHCLTGTGSGLSFAPGYRRGVSPYGRWQVTAAYVDAGWRWGRDPHRDYAFLVVAPRTVAGVARNVQDVVGGARLSPSPAPGAALQVDGYVAGANDEQLGCATTARRSAGYPAFDCGGFADGTSGSPWLQGGALVGLIGGLHQGGCTPDTSYSPPFDLAMAGVYVRASTGKPGDVVPVPGGDGC